jgi:hypothetical protein
VVLQIRAHAWPVGNDRDAEAAQVLRGADASAHQDRW